MNQLFLNTVAGLIILISNNIFAKGLAPEDCFFPRHFSIIGPANTHIKRVQVEKSGTNNLQVKNIKSNGFDLVLLNKQNCSGGTIDLIVGTDEEHWCEIVIVNSSNRINSRYISSHNDFYTKYFDYEISEANIPLVFFQH